KEYGRFTLRGPRFLQTVDQNVDSPPFWASWTRDFEYTPARPAVEFGPTSATHVTDRNPIQEQFGGLHEHENELFRASEGAPEKRPEGVRVASGLAIDDEGGQSQAYGLAPGEVPIPGTVPLCRAYTNKALSLIDWGSPSDWLAASEFGVVRLTTRSMKPVVTPTTLFLQNHACNAAVVSANIRLEPNSAAGLVFRADSEANMYSVIIDTPNKKLTLNRVKEGAPHVISQLLVSYLHPNMRHELKIVDQGKEGTIHVYLDRSLALTHTEPYTGQGSTGVTVTQGHASFDTFSLLP
ncbi:transmembrane protein, partial [Cystoisospora suis]